MHTDLFADFRQPEQNLLPVDGIVQDYGFIFPEDQADVYFQSLYCHTPWQHDEVVMAGQRIQTQRQIAWYADASQNYVYSGVSHASLPWTALLLDIKTAIQDQLHAHFNACLLNLYHDGQEGLAWHSDNEPIWGKQPTIASLSLGASRRFVFKHKITQQKYELTLHHGQLLVMRGQTQNHWLHSLPKMAKVDQPRINLTFRYYL